jgi:hypothetical protein
MDSIPALGAPGKCNQPGRSRVYTSDWSEPQGAAMATMHEIDFQIHGDDMQFVEVELDPAEACGCSRCR